MYSTLSTQLCFSAQADVPRLVIRLSGIARMTNDRRAFMHLSDFAFCGRA
jgi:hypothetical protein